VRVERQPAITHAVSTDAGMIEGADQTHDMVGSNQRKILQGPTIAGPDIEETTVDMTTSCPGSTLKRDPARSWTARAAGAPIFLSQGLNPPS